MIAPIIIAPTILKNIIFIISNIVIGIASLINIIIVIPIPNTKYPIAVNSLDDPIIDINGCTGLNIILSKSPSLMYFGPISYNASNKKLDIPIDIRVIPYNNNTCLKSHPTKFSVF